MSTPVSFPGVAESFKRAIDGVIRPLIGTTATIGGQSITFPTFQIVYDAHVLAIPSSLTLAFLSTIGIDQEEYHIDHPAGSKVNSGFQLRLKTQTEVVVSLPCSPVNASESNRTAIRLYDSIAAVFRAKHRPLADLGLVTPEITAVPKSYPSDQYAMVKGLLTCTLIAEYVRDAT